MKKTTLNFDCESVQSNKQQTNFRFAIPVKSEPGKPIEQPETVMILVVKDAGKLPAFAPGKIYAVTFQEV